MVNNIAQLKKNIVKIVKSLSNVTAIIANQNAPSPALPYIVVDLMLIDDIGHIEKHVDYLNEEFIHFYKQQDEVTVELQCYGTISNDPLDILKLIIYKLSIGEFESDLLNEYGICYRYNNPIVDISRKLDNNNIELRASVDVVFGMAYYNDQYTSTTIDDVEIEQVIL